MASAAAVKTPDFSFYRDCKHDRVISGECQECGLRLSGSHDCEFDMSASYSEHHQRSKITANQNSYERDIKALEIPDDIKTKALELIHSSEHRTHRMGPRKVQIFTFVFSAYLLLGYKDFDPKDLAGKLGMDDRLINDAVDVISGTSSHPVSLPKGDAGFITMPIVNFTPINYIPEICAKCAIPEYTAMAIETGNRVIKADKRLIEFCPRKMAAAIVYYTLTTNGVKVRNFCRLASIPSSQLKDYFSRISIVDNS
jgi:hypothetical protein